MDCAGGAESKDLEYESSEQQRLSYAWEMCTLYEYNSNMLRRKAGWMHLLYTLLVFATTCAAVTLTANGAVAGAATTCDGAVWTGTQTECEETAGTCASADPDILGATTKALCDAAVTTAGTFTASAAYVSTPAWSAGIVTVSTEYNLPTDAMTILAVGCAVVPMVSALVLSMMSRFAYVRRNAMLMVAATRIRSEIYRYRCRVGQYQRRVSNEALDRLLSSQARPGVPANAAPAATTSRKIFSENLQEVRAALQGEEKLAALKNPTSFEVKQLKGLFKSELEDFKLPKKIQRLQRLVKLARTLYDLEPGRATQMDKKYFQKELFNEANDNPLMDELRRVPDYHIDIARLCPGWGGSSAFPIENLHCVAALEGTRANSGSNVSCCEWFLAWLSSEKPDRGARRRPATDLVGGVRQVSAVADGANAGAEDPADAEGVCAHTRACAFMHDASFGLRCAGPTGLHSCHRIAGGGDRGLCAI
jgi:hypothetical protein